MTSSNLLCVQANGGQITLRYIRNIMANPTIIHAIINPYIDCGLYAPRNASISH